MGGDEFCVFTWAGDPAGARIVAVVDAFDAMISARPYRMGMHAREALAELTRCAGSQFDPTVVEAFARVVARAEMHLAAHAA